VDRPGAGGRPPGRGDLRPPHAPTAPVRRPVPPHHRRRRAARGRGPAPPPRRLDSLGRRDLVGQARPAVENCPAPAPPQRRSGRPHPAEVRPLATGPQRSRHPTDARGADTLDGLARARPWPLRVGNSVGGDRR
jgi:hypothetical protein